MSKKIIGVTVGTPLPKPNFKQTDPTKGDYIKNKPDFDGLKSRIVDVEDTLSSIIDPTLSIEGKAADAKATGDALAGKQPVGDYALKSDIPSAPVQSVNNKTGTVTLTASDVGALPDTTIIPSVDGLATESYVDEKVGESVNEIIATILPAPTTTDAGKILIVNEQGKYDLAEAITNDEIDEIVGSTVSVSSEMVDEDTGESYRLYVSNGELKMEQVV